ncbi:hypothetical protein PF008_g11941 [Phytophthora fragariae]|uniref:Uncharacterized protein n=1 Tax=Phytophthora fragariae TaxID=53985 RepID=A0A6G0RQA0_9STRA|nr:hypothetical protein PF008_g11941 [Phytophthora fragariae]
MAPVRETRRAYQRFVERLEGRSSEERQRLTREHAAYLAGERETDQAPGRSDWHTPSPRRRKTTKTTSRRRTKKARTQPPRSKQSPAVKPPAKKKSAVKAPAKKKPAAKKKPRKPSAVQVAKEKEREERKAAAVLRCEVSGGAEESGTNALEEARKRLEDIAASKAKKRQKTNVLTTPEASPMRYIQHPGTLTWIQHEDMLSQTASSAKAAAAAPRSSPPCSPSMTAPPPTPTSAAVSPERHGTTPTQTSPITATPPPREVTSSATEDVFEVLNSDCDDTETEICFFNDGE